MIGEMPWFRVYHRMIDDDKLRLLAFEDRWHFVALCCLKSSGLLDDKTDIRDRKIAVKLGVQIRELDEIGRRLREVGLVDDSLNPVAWDELQYVSDSSTARVKKFREKQRLSSLKQDCNVSVTGQDTDTDTDTEDTTNVVSNIRAREPKSQKAKITIPDWIPTEAWNGWLEMRKAKRVKTTDRAIKLSIGELEKLRRDGHDPGAVLDQSTLAGWTGLFPIKSDFKKGQNYGIGGGKNEFTRDPLRRAMLAEMDQ